MSSNHSTQRTIVPGKHPLALSSSDATATTTTTETKKMMLTIAAAASSNKDADTVVGNTTRVTRNMDTLSQTASNSSSSSCCYSCSDDYHHHQESKEENKTSTKQCIVDANAHQVRNEQEDSSSSPLNMLLLLDSFLEFSANTQGADVDQKGDAAAAESILLHPRIGDDHDDYYYYNLPLHDYDTYVEDDLFGDDHHSPSSEEGDGDDVLSVTDSLDITRMRLLSRRVCGGAARDRSQEKHSLE